MSHCVQMASASVDIVSKIRRERDEYLKIITSLEWPLLKLPCLFIKMYIFFRVHLILIKILNEIGLVFCGVFFYYYFLRTSYGIALVVKGAAMYY